MFSFVEGVALAQPRRPTRSPWSRITTGLQAGAMTRHQAGLPPIRAPSPPPVSCLSGGSGPLAETARWGDYEGMLPDPGCYKERYRLNGGAVLAWPPVCFRRCACRESRPPLWPAGLLADAPPV